MESVPYFPPIKFFIGFDSNQSRDKKRGNELWWYIWEYDLQFLDLFVAEFKIINFYFLSVMACFLYFSMSVVLFFFFGSKILPLKKCNYNHITYLIVNFSVKN